MRGVIWKETKQLSVPHVDSKTRIFPSPCLAQLFPSFIFCQNYRHGTYFSHCCDPNWPHRNIQTASGSIWLLSITEHLFFLNPGELQREANSVLLWRRATSPLSAYRDAEGAAESLGTGALARTVALREQVQGKTCFKAVFKKPGKELWSYLTLCGWK